MGDTTVRVALETPQHSGLTGPLDYQAGTELVPGTLVRVPLGRREVLGIVWPAGAGAGAPEGQALRPVAAVFDGLPPLPGSWLALVDFAAGYYQRGVGELALAVLPPELRKLDAPALAKRQARLLKKLGPPAGVADAPGRPGSVAEVPAQLGALAEAPAPPGAVADVPAQPPLADEQQAALDAFGQALAQPRPVPLLLHGVTGSGKTEVYLRATAQVLALGRQVLVLVPEINLTPQLEARFAARFPAHRLVAMHSGLTPAQRLQHWLTALLGRADIVLGTRMAVFAPLPRLGLVVVDEEHDPSYKQQEGARYSARDLAVYRGHLEQLPVLLGSATPALESWHNADEGRYRRITMAQRIGGGALPRVRIFDMGVLPRVKGQAPVLAPRVLASLQERLARGEQSLVFLNRRGYAPVLHCTDCGWKSGCPHCSAWRVFHKGERSLRCHHCGFTERVPRACPDCGNLDIAPIGRGTEKLEEQLAELLPGARIARLDADTARGKGELQRRLAEVHDGDVDVLVGTQMVTKGHDFRRITLVVALNPDTALFASDFRAPERLFALLMQAAGRAGRDAEAAARSEVWLQTWHPQHPLYAALQAHDFARFAAAQLAERRSASLPPFSHLALLRAEAREAAVAMAFLQAASDAAAQAAEAEGVVVFPPVPPTLSKLAGMERLQMLVEAASRARLQRFLGRLAAAAARPEAGAQGPGALGHRRRPAGHLRWRQPAAGSLRLRLPAAGSARLRLQQPGQRAEADERQHRAGHDDARHAARIGAVAFGQQRHVAGAGQRRGQGQHQHLEGADRRAQLPRAGAAQQHQQRVQQQLQARHRQHVGQRRAVVHMLAAAPQHRADGEQRHRAGRIGQHAHQPVHRPGQPQPGDRGHRAQRDRPRQRVGQGATQRAQHRGACAVLARALQLGQRDAQRAGDEHVGQHGADHRPGRAVAQQRDQQRHPHEAGVGKRRHQRAEGRVLEPNPLVERQGDGHEHHQGLATQVHQQDPGVQQFQQRRVHAEAEQHAWQCEEQHEGVQPRHRRLGQQALARRQPAGQHQRKERDRDGEDGLHGLGAQYPRPVRQAPPQACRAVLQPCRGRAYSAAPPGNHHHRDPEPAVPAPVPDLAGNDPACTDPAGTRAPRPHRAAAMKRLVLVGAGHAHAQVLLAWAAAPPAGCELVLVSPQAQAAYSGMVPGWLAGHYTFDALCIDFQALARAAGARWLATEVTALDAATRQLRLADGQVLVYDLLSLNIGSTLHGPAAPPNGRVLALRPLADLHRAWSQLLADPWLTDSDEPLAVTTVGGGAAGVESLLAVCATLRQRLPRRVLLPRLVTRSDRLLPGMAEGAARHIGQALQAAGVQVQCGVVAERLLSAPARAPGLLLWAAGAQPHGWPRHSGLALDAAGYVAIDAQLRSPSHPEVFAVGDGAAWRPNPLPKAGVFAVRMGPVLLHNLQAALQGRPLQDYRPQRRYLALLATGDRRAVAAWGGWATEGAWAWRWKDRIDRRFIARFRLPHPGG